MSIADDPAGASRYYANPAEQKVLIAGLQRYFSLPERSQNRNRIAKEVSQYLRYFSPHWSHRAVRLWFNNNKPAAEILTSSDIENKFKMAQVLQIRGDFPRAITVFTNVCLAVERVSRANPSAHVELHHIPLSLGKLAEIYLKKEDQEKALAFIQCQKKFFEYIASNMPNLESENSTDGASDLPEHHLPDLFRDMHAVFAMADAPPPRDPQEVVQMVLEAKKKYEQEQAAANLAKLKQIMADREAKKDTSRWLQTLDYIDQHPIRVTLGAVVFMLVFLGITIFSFDTRKISRDDRASRKIGNRTPTRAPGEKPAGPEMPNRDPKATAEEIQKLKDTLESLRKNAGKENL